MLKRLTYILIAGLLMAVVFWVLSWVHRTLVLGLNPFLDLLFIGFVTLVLLPGIIWGVTRLRWPVWKLFAVGCACWVWWSIGWNVLMGNSTLDIHLHDTYYVISGYHYTFFVAVDHIRTHSHLLFAGVQSLCEQDTWPPSLLDHFYRIVVFVVAGHL